MHACLSIWQVRRGNQSQTAKSLFRMAAGFSSAGDYGSDFSRQQRVRLAGPGAAMSPWSPSWMRRYLGRTPASWLNRLVEDQKIGCLEKRPKGLLFEPKFTAHQSHCGRIKFTLELLLRMRLTLNPRPGDILPASRWRGTALPKNYRISDCTATGRKASSLPNRIGLTLLRAPFYVHERDCTFLPCTAMSLAAARRISIPSRPSSNSCPTTRKFKIATALAAA
jgi:hypothetical protein